MITETDFSICPFIKEQMWFFTYYDFCDNRKILRKMYQELNKDAKQFYKWYVYANIYMDLSYKNKIWDYLNGYDDGRELLNSKKTYNVKLVR